LEFQTRASQTSTDDDVFVSTPWPSSCDPAARLPASRGQQTVAMGQRQSTAAPADDAHKRTMSLQRASVGTKAAMIAKTLATPAFWSMVCVTNWRRVFGGALRAGADAPNPTVLVFDDAAVAAVRGDDGGTRVPLLSLAATGRPLVLNFGSLT